MNGDSENLQVDEKDPILWRKSFWRVNPSAPFNFSYELYVQTFDVPFVIVAERFAAARALVNHLMLVPYCACSEPLFLYTREGDCVFCKATNPPRTLSVELPLGESPDFTPEATEFLSLLFGRFANDDPLVSAMKATVSQGAVARLAKEVFALSEVRPQIPREHEAWSELSTHFTRENASASLLQAELGAHK